MVLFWCRPPRKPFKDKVFLLLYAHYTYVCSCVGVPVLLLTFVFQLLCSFQIFFASLKCITLTLIWTLKNTSFCFIDVCLCFWRKQQLSKVLRGSSRWVHCQLLLRFMNHPQEKEGARKLHRPRKSCALRLLHSFGQKLFMGITIHFSDMLFHLVLFFSHKEQDKDKHEVGNFTAWAKRAFKNQNQSECHSAIIQSCDAATFLV